MLPEKEGGRRLAAAERKVGASHGGEGREEAAAVEKEGRRRAARLDGEESHSHGESRRVARNGGDGYMRLEGGWKWMPGWIRS